MYVFVRFVFVFAESGVDNECFRFVNSQVLDYLFDPKECGFRRKFEVHHENWLKAVPEYCPIQDSILCSTPAPSPPLEGASSNPSTFINLPNISSQTNGASSSTFVSESESTLNESVLIISMHL